MKEIKPSATIKPQPQTTVPTNADATIMDDTVVTMDSATALMGGPTVSQPVMKAVAKNTAPRPGTRLQR